jgi:hypothetical protein
MIVDQLVNIDHQIFYEDLTFTLLKSLPFSFHALVVSHGTHIDQLSMELVSGQLLQEKLQCK